MYTWIAIYRDGSHTIQVSPGRGEVSSEAIRREHLARLVIRGHDGRPVFSQNFEDGQRPIYRRRVEKQPDGTDVVCHLVGWHRTMHDADGRPEDIQHVTYLFEDGRIVAAGKFIEDHPWFYSPVWTDREMVAVGQPPR